MKEKTWAMSDKQFKDALRAKKVSHSKTLKFRWTQQEEEYLMKNIGKLGVHAVSRNLRRTPIAIRAKFLRLAGIIDKNGRMTVSLVDGIKQDGSKIDKNLLVLVKTVYHDSLTNSPKKSTKKMSTKNKQKVPADTKTNSMPVEVKTTTENKVKAKVEVENKSNTQKNSNNLVILAIVLSIMSVLISLFAMVAKFLI